MNGGSDAPKRERPSGFLKRRKRTVIIALLTSPIWGLLLWNLLFVFGTLKIVNQSNDPITGGVLESDFGEQRIGSIAPGEFRRLFFRPKAELGWRVQLNTVDGGVIRNEYGYYVQLLDYFINDTLIVTPEGARIERDDRRGSAIPH
jgi:hypothetical protein